MRDPCGVRSDGQHPLRRFDLSPLQDHQRSVRVGVHPIRPVLVRGDKQGGLVRVERRGVYPYEALPRSVHVVHRHPLDDRRGVLDQRYINVPQIPHDVGHREVIPAQGGGHPVVLLGDRPAVRIVHVPPQHLHVAVRPREVGYPRTGVYHHGDVLLGQNNRYYVPEETVVQVRPSGFALPRRDCGGFSGVGVTS